MASNKAVTPASNSLNNYETHLLKGNGSAVKGYYEIGIKMQANGWECITPEDLPRIKKNRNAAAAMVETFKVRDGDRNKKF